ncbi:MAG: RNA pyrophosphohydrolase [Rickettsiaceae bacterium]|nr:RNA pyrophosphohydrolase [Rickettsiaceae bacterium]
MTAVKEHYFNSNKETLPYRPCVGMMIINSDKKVFLARRIDTKTKAWQMPQGGINQGETPSKAAFREMREEIGTDQGKIIKETKNWYCYDVPDYLVSKLWGGNYRGQRQKWFLIKFEGSDSDININTKSPEFCDWQWADANELPDIIVPFKKKLYLEVIKEFSDHIF